MKIPGKDDCKALYSINAKVPCITIPDYNNKIYILSAGEQSHKTTQFSCLIDEGTEEMTNWMSKQVKDHKLML